MSDPIYYRPLVAEHFRRGTADAHAADFRQRPRGRDRVMRVVPGARHLAIWVKRVTDSRTLARRRFIKAGARQRAPGA